MTPPDFDSKPLYGWVGYRRLPMAESDPVTAQLLRLLADESERGVLCVSGPKAVAVSALKPA
jgi:hypothetical protein